MPAVNWVIEPVFLSRKPLPPDKEVDELEAITNNTLVSLIKQLSCLALISNTIFNELSSEVESINQKTERLKLKISNCHSIVANLNHKTVKVPLGTINDFMRITDHFKVTREMTSNLFTPDKRAPCIQYAYEKASISPINQFKLDDYKHLNGYLGSPFFADTKSKVEILEIEQQKPEKLARAVKLPRTVLIEKVKTPITVTRGDTTTLTTTNFNNTILNCDGNNHSINVYDEPDVDSIYQLPSPKEVTEALAQEYPASFIPIDVSSFQRMSSFRRSLIHGDQQIPRRRISSRNKRANRRNTIHETGKSATTERPKSSKYNRERRNSDPSSLNRIDESCQTERTEEAIYSTGRIVSLGRESVIKRRSFGGTKLEFRAEVHREDDRSDIFSGSVITVKSIGTSSSRLGPNLSTTTVTGNSIGVGRSPSSGKDPSSSSLLTTSDVSGTSGTTIVEKRLSSASNQQQQQSAVEVKNYLTSDGIKMRDGSTTKGPGDDGRSSSGNWSASSSTHASVDSDSIAGKYGTVTGGVRTHHNHQHLRGSSNCPPPGSPSGSSLGKDSVLSESLTLTTQQDTDRGGYTAGGDSNGYVSDTSAISSSCALSRSDQRRPSGLEKSREETNYSAICGSNGQPAVITRSSKSGLLTSSLNRSSSSQHSEHSTSGRSIKFANRDSESWLKYFDCSTETLTPEIITTAANETNVTNNGVCKQNPTKIINESPHHLHPYAYHHIHHHRSPLHLPHHPLHPHHQNGANDFAHIDDEVESVYSVDTDGYYTSMHTDSGLFRDVKSTGVGPMNVSEGRGSSVVSPSSESNILTSPGTSCNGRLRASSISSNSTIGDMSLTSMYSKTDTEAPAEVASNVASPSISPSHHQQAPKSNKTNSISTNSTSTTAIGAIKKTSPVKPGRSTNKVNSTADQPPPSSSASLTLSPTAKWTKRVVPPQPPVRMSSIRKNNSTNSKNTNQLVNSATINSHSKSSESNLSSGQPQSKSVSPLGDYDYTSIRSQSQLSSLSIRGHSESEQSDKLGERVRSKTCIGSTDYPSLCNVTSSSGSSSSSSSASSSSSSKLVSSSPAASRSSSDNCDHLSSNGASSADENLEKINEQSDKQIPPVTKEKQKKSKKLFSSYKPFKIKEIFSFGTLNKKSKVSPVTSVDDRKGFMSYESICTDPKGESTATHCPSSRRSSGCESIPGYNQSKTLNGQNSISGTDLYKSQSIEKNLATLRKVDSNPYLPKPITDQGFFQSLLRTDFRSRSEEQLENDKNRRTSGQEREKETKSTKDQQSAKVTEPSNHEIAEILDSKSDDKVETNDSNFVRPSTLILPYKIKQQQVKVELDSNGRLLYPSNSLGRRRDDHPMAYLERTKKMDEENAKWSTLPKPKVENQYLIGQRSTPTTATTTMDKLAHKNCTKSVDKQTSGLNESMTTSPTVTSEDLNKSNQSSSSSSFITPPPTLTSSLGPLSSTPRRPIARIQLPQESNSTSNTTPTTVSPTTTSGRVGPPTFPKPRFNIYRHSFSGLGSLERRSAQDALKVNINSTSPADQPTTTDLPSPIGSSMISPGAVKSKLSTSDLISLIHDSKRRLGQRSANSSPSPITSPQSEPLPSPPNLLSPNQRRSWSFTKEMTNGFDNMIPGVNQGNEDGPRCRRSLCSDRLGPMRPTSIHDFKKLIAAARPVGSTHKPTFSAKDLLQAAPISTISSVNSPRSRPSTPLTTSPISMTNNLINEMSQPQQPTPSTLSLTISSSLPSPNSSTSSPQSSTTPPNVHLKVPLSSSPSPVSSSSSPSTLRDSRTRVINGRIYRSPYRLEVMCPPIEEDDIMEETTVNHNNNNQAINSSSTIPFQVSNDYKNGLTFIGSKEIKKHLISSGFYPNPSSTTTQPPTPTIKATSTWV